MLDKNFKTIETGIEKLRTGVKIRDKMGGAMYWSILNDECCQIGNKLLTIGGNRKEIDSIIGTENFK